MRRQFLWFLVVGTIGFIIDAGLTYALTSLLGFHPVAARIPAIMIAVLVTFLLNKYLTFQAQEQSFAKSFAAYIASNAAAQGFNFSIYSALVLLIPAFTANPVAAVAAGSISAMALSFTLSKYWVFKA